MKAEFLARARDCTAFIEDKAGDGRGVLVGKLPAKRPVQIADGHRTIDNPRPVRLRRQAGKVDIMFVIDVADNLLQDVLKRDDALKVAIFIDHNGKMFPPCPESLKLVEKKRGFGNEIGLACNILQQAAPVVLRRLFLFRWLLARRREAGP